METPDRIPSLALPSVSAVQRAMLALVVAMTLAPANSEALTDCKVHVNSKNGTIDVSATGVSGPLTWGVRTGSEPNTFANAATCISGTSASKCEFGAPGSLETITPPDLCTLYLKDD